MRSIWTPRKGDIEVDIEPRPYGNAGVGRLTVAARWKRILGEGGAWSGVSSFVSLLVPDLAPWV